MPLATALACVLAACLLLITSPSHAAKPPKAALKKSEAQKLIAAYSLLELDKGAVNVKEIAPGAASAAVTAGVRVGFRFERDAKGGWHAVEMRVGDRRWEDLDLLARALGNDSLAPTRAALDSFAAELDALARAKKQRDEQGKKVEGGAKNSRAADPSGAGAGGGQSGEKAAESAERPKRPKKPDQKKPDQKTNEKPPELVRGALSVKNPESALSPVGKSAVVEAEIEATFDVVREGGAWRVASARIGGVKLPDSEALSLALDAEKRRAARADLEALARALEAFRKDRGFYVVADTEAALVDFLNPRYMTAFIRVDPWHRPYEYRGTRDAYTLRSNGPDGKPNTSDDVTVEGPRPARAAEAATKSLLRRRKTRTSVG